MNYRAVIFDVDGTIVRGDTPIDGARVGLETAEDAGLNRLFVSNNPTKMPPAYQARLAHAGVTVTGDDVITAGTATTTYLSEFHANEDIFLIGEPGVSTQFEEAGLSQTESVEQAETLVASIDFNFSYQDLQDSLTILKDPSIPFIGTDPDIIIPTDHGDIPGSGAIIGAIENVTNRSVEQICGKPSPYTAQLALDRLGNPDPSECLVVGDRLDTDILLGKNAGMTTVLVKTGVTDNTTLSESDIQPDYVLESLAEFDRVLY
ncbi:HAD-IIA family hydrolase [Natronocalculus amylovorans]|uniref:HAD-IIA family hydrolase n=1 Tax=Natronocalculus amylovorans TaxID=2917812 RepID=A0AAE3FWT4_9EURY|nr:HAD-IIA family hydrolase [Natronocalculus amylovorans]MCL9817037.1 HAD-IIA family hydrolase [Natronocalculus amylovorans]